MSDSESSDVEIGKLEISEKKVLKLKFTLSKQAKSKGGDKYQCSTIESFNMYIPQSISRSGGDPKKKLTVTIG